MSSEPSSSALLAALRLTAPDLAPDALDDEVDAAELWLETTAERGPDDFHAQLLGGIEMAAGALRASPRPLLFVIGMGPCGRPEFRLLPVASARAMRLSAAFLAQDAPRHDMLVLDGRPEPTPCVTLPLDPDEVSRRRRPSLGELKHYVASQLVPRLGDVRRLPGADTAAW